MDDEKFLNRRGTLVYRRLMVTLVVTSRRVRAVVVPVYSYLLLDLYGSYYNEHRGAQHMRMKTAAGAARRGGKISTFSIFIARVNDR